MQTQKSVSIIIATHNRSRFLPALLNTLAKQDFPQTQMQVIVVEHGCTDNTEQMLHAVEMPFDLLVLRLDHKNVAAARNYGAAHAESPLLLLLGDDVQPTPDLVAQHVAAQQHKPGCVSVGFSPIENRLDRNWYNQEARTHWSDYYQSLRQPGHRVSYRDLPLDNLAMPADLYASLGGCNEKLPGHAEYDLGLRLIERDTPICFVPEALARREVNIDLADFCESGRQAGIEDVQFVQLYPQLWQDFPLASYKKSAAPQGSLRPLLRQLAFRAPEVGDHIAAWMDRYTIFLERLHTRARWRLWAYDLQDYWYWRGVAGILGSRKALRDLIKQASQQTVTARTIKLDLQAGVAAAEDRLDQERPDGAELYYGNYAFGTIPARPGAEGLRGAHLRPLLRDVECAWPMVLAIGSEQTGSPQLAQNKPYLVLETRPASAGKKQLSEDD